MPLAVYFPELAVLPAGDSLAVTKNGSRNGHRSASPVGGFDSEIVPE